MDSQDPPGFTERHAPEQSMRLGSEPPNPASHIAGEDGKSFDWDSFDWNTQTPTVLREFDQRHDVHPTSTDDHGYDNSEQNELSVTQVTLHTTQSGPPSPNVPDQTSARAIERTGSAPPPVHKSAVSPYGQQDSSPSAPHSTAATSHIIPAFSVAPITNSQVERVAHSEPLGCGNQSSTITRSHSPEKANHLPTVSSPLNQNVGQPLGGITKAHYSRGNRPADDNLLVNDASAENSYPFTHDNIAPVIRGDPGLTELDNEDIIAGGPASMASARGPLHHHTSQRSETDFQYLLPNGVLTGGYARQGRQHAASSSYEPVFGYTQIDLHTDSPTPSRYEQSWGGHSSRARTFVPLHGPGIPISTLSSVPSHGFAFDSPLSQGHAASQNRQMQPKQEQYLYTPHWQSFPDRHFQQQSRALWPTQTVDAQSVTGQHISHNTAHATQSSFYVPDDGLASQGVLTSPQDIARQALVLVRFESLKQAEDYFHRIANPKDPGTDPTFPFEPVQQIQAVKRIIYAMCHMRHAADNEPMKRMWERAQREKDSIEDTAWKVLRRCMDAAVQRDPLVPKSRPAHSYNTFGAQLDDICEALMTEKTICKHLCGAPYIDTFIDDPLSAACRVKNNRKVNGGKKKTIAQGKEALKLVGQQRSETSMEPGYDMLLGSSEQQLTRHLTQHQGSLSETQSLLDNFDSTPEAEAGEEQQSVHPQEQRTARVRITESSSPRGRNQASATEMQNEYQKPITRGAAAKKSSRVETTTRSTRKRRSDTGDEDATYQPKTTPKRTRKTKKESKYPTIRLPSGEYVVRPSAPTPPSSTPPPPASTLSSSPYVPSSTSYSSPAGAVSHPRARTQYLPNPYQPNVYHQTTSYDGGYMANTVSYQNPNVGSSSGLAGQPSTNVYHGYGNGLPNYGQQYGAHFSNIRGQYDGHQDLGPHQSFSGTLRSESHIDPSLSAMNFNNTDQGNQDFEHTFGGGSTAVADHHSNVDDEDEFDEDETYGGRQPGEGRGKRRRARPTQR